MRTKEEIALYAKEWREKNKEIIKIKQKLSYEKNKEDRLLQNEKYRQENLENIKIKRHENYLNKRDLILLKQKQDRINNPEKYKIKDKLKSLKRAEKRKEFLLSNPQPKIQPSLDDLEKVRERRRIQDRNRDRTKSRREYYEKNKEILKEKRKLYKLNNRDKINEYQNKRYKKSREGVERIKSPGAYNIKLAERHKELWLTENLYFYHLKLIEDDGTIFYKYGLTKSLDTRLRKIPYDVEILETILLNKYDAVWKEYYSLKKVNRYIPQRIFGGYTECFN